MEIVPLSAVGVDTWAAFVDSCDECWLYHHPAFFDVASEDSRSFAVLDRGRIAGGCVLFVNRSGLGKMLGGRFGSSGLALRPEASHRAYPLVRNYLFESARKDGCHAIQMGMPALAPAYRSADYLDTHLCHLGFTNTLRWGTLTHYTPSYTTVIDLALPLDQIWRAFATSVRQKCAHASQVPFTHEFVQNGVTDEAWAAFVVNHQTTMRLGGTHSLPATLLARLRDLVAKGYGALINIGIGDTIAASLLLLTYKQSAFYFASGVRPDAYAGGFAAQLHWTAIHELKNRGFKEYEVGQFFPALRGTKLGHLGDFKRRFGGSKRAVLTGELVTQELRFLGLDLMPAYGKQWAKKIYRSVRRS